MLEASGSQPPLTSLCLGDLTHPTRQPGAHQPGGCLCTDPRPASFLCLQGLLYPRPHLRAERKPPLPAPNTAPVDGTGREARPHPPPPASRPRSSCLDQGLPRGASAPCRPRGPRPGSAPARQSLLSGQALLSHPETQSRQIRVRGFSWGERGARAVLGPS